MGHLGSVLGLMLGLMLGRVLRLMLGWVLGLMLGLGRVLRLGHVAFLWVWLRLPREHLRVLGR